MKIIVEGDAKEIAALVLELQERRKELSDATIKDSCPVDGSLPMPRGAP